jgi:sugar lactone lactonase YvrE
MKLGYLAAITAVVVLLGWRAQAQAPAMAPTNDPPNPFQTITDYFKLPDGRTWGSTSAVEIDRDGRSIWVAERCGTNSCLDRANNTMSNLPSVLKFDQSGKLVASFGAGLLIFPHGIHVDRDGNVWVTDGNDNAPAPARGAGAGGGAAAGGGAGRGAGAAAGAPGGGAQGAAGAAGGRGRGPAVPPRANPAATKGHQVFKFSPDGKVLLTLGKPGGDNAPGYFFQPNDVLTNDAGEIFVSEGHSSTPGTTARILKFSKDGKLIKEWGTFGDADGQLNQPHALAFDSRGRLFVGDRGNNQVVIFDQDGKFIARWPQFSRPSGIYIDKRTDTLYVADSESGSVNPAHGAWKRGIRIGSARDGKVQYFIPDPNEKATGTSAAEGVVVDNAGNVYGAEVGPRQVKKYVKK